MIAYLMFNVVLAIALSADAAWLTQKKGWFWGTLPLTLIMCFPYTKLYPVFVYTVALVGVWQLIHMHHRVSWKVLPVCFALSLGITALGMWNFERAAVRHIEVVTEKPVSARVVFLSDLHYPNGWSEDKLERIIMDLRKETPDVYILGGDVVDDETSPEEMKMIFEALGTLDDVAPVVYVYGNHDGKGSEEALCEALESSRVQLLEDECIQLSNLVIVGRDDRKHDKERAAIEELMPEKTDSFIIVADHEPVQGELVSRAGADLMLSGHTHNGQLWPFGEFINFAPAYDMTNGIRYVGDMMQVTSGGLGGWGFPVRTAGVNEYVVLDIRPQEKGA